MRWVCCVLALVVAGCAADTVADGPGPATQPSTTTSTTATATAQPSSTTTATTLATTTTTVVTTLAPTTEVPRLDDGRPSTFLAVTAQFEALEVDTATGRIVRTLGQAAGPEDLDPDCAACVNVIDAVWRLADGSALFISECCEPASGVIFRLDGETLDPATKYDTQFFTNAWSVAPAPISARLATFGYQVGIWTADGSYAQIGEDDGDLGNGAPTWLRDESALVWIDRNPWELVSASIAGEDPPGRIRLDWVEPGALQLRIATQSTGDLVAFRDTNGTTEGVVFSPSGALVATFPVEPGSELGGYDSSGRFLIYVDGDGTVRWQGLGRSGSLGSGYVSASW